MVEIDGLMLAPEKAVIVGDTAIIADLHLGIENVVQDYGITVPRLQIREITRSVKSIVKRYGISRLVVAGDLKHEFGRNLPYEWDDVESFLETFTGMDVEIEIVRGNHDNFLATILSRYGVELKESVSVSGWTVAHGHTEINAERMIMGHEHPGIRIRSGGGVYSYPCFLHVKERNIIVLPAFSPLTPGIDILNTDSFLSPILKVDIENVEVYAVEDRVVYLGRVRDIRKALRV